MNSYYLKFTWQLSSRCRLLLNNYARFKHATPIAESAKAVSLAEDVFYPPDSTEDSKRCLIIAHGLFGFKTNWRSIAKVFSERAKLKVVTVDMRNHGDSPRNASMTYFDMAADLVQTVRKHQAANTILMGHSMGGKAAMIVALQEPTLLRKLIVVDIAPTVSASVDEIPSYTRILLDNLHRIQYSKDIVEARRTMDRIFQSSAESLRKNKGIRDFLLMLIGFDEATGQYVWRADLEVIEEYMTELMDFPAIFDNATTDVDTLFIAGGNSNYITDESLPKMRRLFPSYRLVRIPNAGHWVHSERPQDFIKCVLPELN